MDDRPAAFDRQRVLMVGDRLDTDVAFGAGGGLRTMLVLSGCTTPDALAGHLDAHAAAAEVEGGGEAVEASVGGKALGPAPTFFGSSVAALVCGEGGEGKDA